MAEPWRNHRGSLTVSPRRLLVFQARLAAGRRPSFRSSVFLPRRPRLMLGRGGLRLARLAPAGFSWSGPTRRAASSFTAPGDTIYALSSGSGRAGIAIIRLSGPSCLDVYRALCPTKALPRPRYAAVRTLWVPEPPCSPAPATIPSPDAVVLDPQALVLFFPAPASLTGEDVLELHVHGGPATVKATLAALPRCRSGRGRIRYAEPGEFTQRAFIHDHLDLGQVEALADALAAETEQQRRTAVRGSSGALGRAYEAWRRQLLLARGEMEALIDFAEDQHLDQSQPELLASVASQVDAMLRSIRLHEEAGQRSELLRSGIRIALLGPPNVGKSSLMNLIVGREASIVSPEAGTTRDVVEVNLDLRGFLCSFADTAGFRSLPPSDAAASVEAEGIRRARRAAQASHLVVVLASVETDARGPFVHYDAKTLDLAAAAAAHIIVVNKRDRIHGPPLASLIDRFCATLRQSHPALAATPPLAISCNDAPSSVDVVDALTCAFTRMTDLPVPLQDLLGVTMRQRQLLARCRLHLEAFMAVVRPREAALDDDDAGTGAHQSGELFDLPHHADPVVAAEYLRYAADCLARITGKGEAGDIEEVLGVVFEKFCVGK